MSTDHSTAKQRLRLVVTQLPLIVALVVLWCFLWGQFTWVSLITGIVIAIVVGQLFYLPPVELGGRLNLVAGIAFLGVLFVDIVRASFTVAAQAIAGPREPRNAIVEVDLVSHEDLIITATAEAISLVPGSLIVEVDRDRGRLYLHVLGADRPGKIAHAKRSALATERWILRAIGSRDDLRRSRELAATGRRS